MGCAIAYIQSGKIRNSPPPMPAVGLQSAEKKPEQVAPVVPSLPARLIIPSIKVDSQIEYSGVTPAGNMAVPSDIAKVGWYKLGPLPGNKGSAVMSGHVNGPQGQPGVFARLADLRVGDTVESVDTNGLTTVFTVKETKRYSKDDQPDEVFHSAEGVHLNLITCVGDWNATERQYSERLVVFADKL